jgi:tocopherol O-methyltransferase
MTASVIADYYDATGLDYRVFWMNGRNRSMHFGYWDEQTRRHADSLVRMNAVIADEAKVKPGELVLDAGCGLGGTALWLAVERQARVVGVTLSGKHVRVARRAATARGLRDRCTFSQQDFRRLPCGNDRFDVVWAHESVCHAPDKDAFLREAFRVLAPGGRLVCADGFRTRQRHTPDDEQHLAAWLHSWAVQDLATSAEFTEWAVAAGFEDVLVRDVSAQVAPSLMRLHRIGGAFVVPATFLYYLGVRSPVQQGNVRGARLAWQTFRRGLWHYAIVVARKPTGSDATPSE